MPPECSSERSGGRHGQLARIFDPVYLSLPQRPAPLSSSLPLAPLSNILPRECSPERFRGKHGQLAVRVVNAPQPERRGVGVLFSQPSPSRNLVERTITTNGPSIPFPFIQFLYVHMYLLDPYVYRGH